DGVHTTDEGDRLRAWGMFQGLVPIIREKLRSGQLPVADRLPLSPPDVSTRLPRTALVCTDYSRQRRLEGALSLQALHGATDEATVSGEGSKHVVTSGARYSYAAEAPFADVARLARPGVVLVKAHVTSGIVSIGVLRRDRSAFIVTRTLQAGQETDVFLPVAVLADAGVLVISNASGTPGERSSVDLEDVAVLSARAGE
ncbi:MAG TPA: hypothetical protein VLV86_18540, partial [Vicinamibacterales bacterium]|nr:hypothetical protein [Vicinamibacterales bacterium]